MKEPSAFKTVLTAGLLAGTLDLTAAIVFLAKMKAVPVLKYIASGAFGKAAYTDDPKMVSFGIIFHYLIALTIATIYFLIYPRLSFLKYNTILSAIIIGTCSWAFMNLVVVPMSQIGPSPFNLESAIKNAVILMVCIGLPISILTRHYYQKAGGASV